MALPPPILANSPPRTVDAGGIPLTTFYDGILKSAYDAYHHVSPDDLQAALGHLANDEAPFTDSNCFLLETKNGLALMDSGSGTHLDDTAGLMAGQLAGLGVKPEDIAYVLMTHLHADHVGGLIDAHGHRLFPRAQMMLHEDEARYWSEAPPGVAGEHHPADLSGMALRAYSDTAMTFRDGDEVLPGIVAMHLPGHTPGHSGYLVGGDRDGVFVWGDIVHVPEVQFDRPEITTVYDFDVAQAEATRHRALAFALDRGLRVAGMHFRQPPLGKIVNDGASYSLKAI